MGSSAFLTVYSVVAGSAGTVEGAKAAVTTAACSTSWTRADPAEGAAIARRDMPVIPVSRGSNCGSATARNVQAPWLAGSSWTQRKSVTSG